MKWFKHDSDARHDARLQRVRLKYGMEGYGLYFFLLECIAGTVEKHNLSFELEEDAELVSVATGIHTELVQEMMVFMVNLGLFENAEGRITCLKMASRTDEYTQKLIKQSNGVGTLSRQTPDTLGRKSELIEEKRTEEKRREKHSRRFTPPTLEEVSEYCKSRGNAVSPERFIDHYQANGWMRGKNKIKDWKACVRTWERKEPEHGESYF